MKLLDYEKKSITYVIAEIAQAHDGSVGILHSLVEAAASTGVDAVKFQVHISEAESSPLEPFRVKFSYVDATRYEYWKRMELSLLEWEKIKKHCDDLGVEFLATPFSNAAVDLLEHLGVKRYKVGSGDAANPLLLEKIARTGKEMILSTGLTTLAEIDSSVALLRRWGVEHAILQCTSSYPTPAEEVNLGRLHFLRERYGCPVGLSDHSGTIYPGIGAVALGASVVEAHITFDQRMFGPDARASLAIDDFTQMVRGVRYLEKARSVGSSLYLDTAKQQLRSMFGKAIAINRDLPAGHVIAFDDLEGKKPAGSGISVAEVGNVIGRTLVCNKKRWDFISQDDLK